MLCKKIADIKMVRLLQWVSSLYAGCIALWFLLRLAYFDTLWWIAILNTIALYLFLPIPFLLGIIVRRQQYYIIGILGIPIALFCWLFGIAFLPKWAPTSTIGTSVITVQTFNVLYRNHDTEAIITAIRTANADIIGFQELTSQHKTALIQTLHTDYPYYYFQKTGAEAGTGIISRFPVTAVGSFSLPPRNLSLHATLLVKGMSLHVLVVHLTPNRMFQTPLLDLPAVATMQIETQRGEITHILQEVHKNNEPTLVLCDCNLAETSQAYTTLATVLNDSFREVGRGLGHTYPAGLLPLQRYDYVWHSNNLVALAAWTGSGGGSDHLSVLTQLAIGISKLP